MKKYLIKYGLIIGLINSIGLFSLIFSVYNYSFQNSEVIGYTLMIIAFGFVYLGIKSYRDELAERTFGFGKGLMTGLLMTFIGASIYVITWLIIYYTFFPDFMNQYADACLERMKKSGRSDLDLTEKMNEIKTLKELYQNPFMIVLITYAEILPVGIVASFVSSLVLRRKPKG